MSDIVDRLRQGLQSSGREDEALMFEAADEIVRLLAERKYLGELHRQEWEAQVARTKKAEAERDDYRFKGAAHIKMLAVNNDELRAEIEKLRAELEAVKETNQKQYDIVLRQEQID